MQQLLAGCEPSPFACRIPLPFPLLPSQLPEHSRNRLTIGTRHSAQLCKGLRSLRCVPRQGHHLQLQFQLQTPLPSTLFPLLPPLLPTATPRPLPARSALEHLHSYRRRHHQRGAGNAVAGSASSAAVAAAVAVDGIGTLGILCRFTCKQSRYAGAFKCRSTGT